jgi:hypothetical protein
MSPNPPPVKVDIPHKDKISLFMHEFIEKVMDDLAMIIVDSV